MKRFKKQLEIGLRWVRCGWRLFLRNPWLLGGMGLFCVVGIAALTLIPLVGGLLIALLAPVALASAYLAIDKLSRQKMALPASLRGAAIKQSPRELLGVFRDDDRAVPMVLLGIYSLAVALLINIAVQLLAGSAWVDRWMNLDAGALLGVLATAILALSLYVLLAASLVYALPLAFLQDEPLVPAVGRSLKASARHLFALSVILGLLLAPFFLGAIASYLSIWATYLAWLVVGTVVLPVVAASSYCSYRTLFPVREASFDE